MAPSCLIEPTKLHWNYEIAKSEYEKIKKIYTAYLYGSFISFSAPSAPQHRCVTITAKGYPKWKKRVKDGKKILKYYYFLLFL